MRHVYQFIVENINAKNIEKNTAIRLLTMLKQEKTDLADLTEDIAIIGMAIKFPLVQNLEEFWRIIQNKVDCVRKFPDSRRKDIDRYLAYSDFFEGNFGYSEGAYLEAISGFDYKFFKLSPKEASLMNPCQRLFLQTAMEAIEDAGYGGEKLAGSNTGVFLGFADNYKDSYQKLVHDVEITSISSSVAANIGAMIPSRISYFLNLKGPSMVIDTACSASLVAVHMACQAVKNGECDMAIAGGMKIHLLPVEHEYLKIGIESTDGRTRAFDDSSDGSGIGEGVAAVLLKPLRKAKADGDSIYAVIKGSAINQDGSSMGITAPNPEAQTEVIVKAWENAGIDPETISYIEVHGTGTKLGDPIEIKGLQEAFLRYTDKKQFCAISSVKTNLGHLYECAGIANLIKAVLALKYKEIPASIHFNNPNQKISFEESPVYVNTKPRKWEAGGAPRRCGISSFGLSGTNCHMILEEAPEIIEQPKTNRMPLHIFTLSAKSRETLCRLIDNYKVFLKKTDCELDNICYTANTGRGHYNFRLAMVIRDINELQTKLNDLTGCELENISDKGVYYGEYRIVLEIKKEKEIGELTESQRAKLTTEAYSKIREFIATGRAKEEILHDLCRFYVMGADIRWEDLYDNQKLKREHLPTYPFEQKRCWIEVPEGKKKAAELPEDHMFYTTIWREEESNEDSEICGNPSTDQGLVLILKDRQGIGEQLVNRFRNEGRTIIEVELADEFRKNGEDAYEIKGTEEDYQNLIRDIKHRQEGLGKIIHLFALDHTKEVTCVNDLDESLKKGVYSLFYLVKALENNGMKDRLDLILAANYVSKVTGEEAKILPENASFFGLAKAISRECPHIMCRLIDLDESTDREGIFYEAKKSGTTNQIAYRKGQRYLEEFTDVDLSRARDEEFRIKKDGVYVITGGTGGIGLEVAKYLSTKNRVKLALINRSTMPARDQWADILNEGKEEKLCQKIRQITDIEATGSQVLCYSADISDFSQTREVIDDIRNRFGEINGIIHGAGILSDELLATRSESEFRRVSSPKIQGTWILDHLTKSDNLDFFMMFSSICTIFSGPGQGDYTAANSYLDSFAACRSRQGKKTLTINWATWKETGMAAEYGFNFDTLYKTITTKEAMAGFDRVLHGNTERVLIGKINYKSKLINKLEQYPFKLSKRICHALQTYGKSAGLKIREEKHRGEVKLTGNDAEGYTKTQEFLGQVLGEVLGVDEVNIYDNFFELGVDSISLMKIMTRINSHFNTNVSFNVFIEGANLAKLAALVDQNRNNACGVTYPSVKPDFEQINLPFPLTNVQMAYVAGREDAFELGGVSTHAYFELETSLDMHRLEKALQALIKRHPMLRAVILPDGRQQILKDAPEYKLEVIDLTGVESKTRNAYLSKERERMSHHIFALGEWPMFEFKAFKISEDKHYLFVGIDLLIADGLSIQLLGKELLEYYEDPDRSLPEIKFTFRDYVMAYEEIKESKAYAVDKKYWLDKLDDFPAAPSLPLKQKPAQVSRPHFKRLSRRFDKRKWERLKEKAKLNNITPSIVLCTAYAEVPAFWSNQSRLAINLAAYNRFPFHEHVEMVVGDFTTVMLIDIDLPPNTTFWEKARNIQHTMLEVLEHRHYDGVEFIREILKRDGVLNKAVMPIVFTSMLLDTAFDGWFRLGEIKTAVSQTSQVYLDNQIAEVDGDLVINWDYVEELFDPVTVETMFTQYTEMILALMESDEEYVLEINEADRRLISAYNDTDEDIIHTTLHQLFMAQTARSQENIAVRSVQDEITYKELHEKSNQIARYLLEKRIKRNELVGVIAERCIDTIVNILGVLKAGGAYVPIDPAYPEERKNYILQNSNCRLILHPHLYSEKKLHLYSTENVKDNSRPEDMAYVIYTSGSTGRPKGVIITHQEVTNTIIDINKKFNISEEDRIIGLSSFCFDLSVFDIFGALSSGATLVMIPDQRDVRNIMDVIRKHKITVWNSVPAIMEMLVDYLDSTNDRQEQWEAGEYTFRQERELEGSEEDKYYWSPIMHWEKSGKTLRIGDTIYTGVMLDTFPDFYYLTQKGITIKELREKFPWLDASNFNSFIKRLIRERVLVKSLLTPKEVFSTQNKLFNNKYGEEIIFVAEEYEKFKDIQLKRSFKNCTDLKVLLDPGEEYPAAISKRRSYRIFNQKDKIPFLTFSRLLSVFRQIREENKIRYYYACAGGLYPIDIFVYVKENRVEGLEQGLYYYNPRENALYLVNNHVITDQAHYFINKAIYNSSAFSLFFIYNAEVTMPKYGADGYFYACIDTGIMVSTLTHVAELLNIGLCSIGDMMFEEIRENFNLAEEQVWIHTVEGGIKPYPEGSIAAEERVYGFTDVDRPEESDVRTIVSVTTDSNQENELSNHLRLVLLSGDWIPVKLPERIEEYFCQAKIVSLGGATEASIWSIYYPIDKVKEDWVSIPYGMPLANQKFYVLDYEHRLCPVGVQGELYIGGLGVAEGYLNDAEKTRNSFIHHPELGRLYRTGDYGILHKNGYIEFLGRKDHQVKIRGYRIELGEVESCLLKHSSVKRAVVVDVKDKEGKKSLCAYIVPKARVTGKELREHLLKLLPDYMIPSYFVQLTELPLTLNGKVNIKALPEPEQTMDDGNEYMEAQNEIEEKLVTIWTSLLGVEKVGTNDNFFEKGGNSILLVRMHNEIEKLYPGSTRIADLFNNPTIISQAEYIKNSIASSSGDLRRKEVPILEPLPFPADYFVDEHESSEETFLEFHIPGNLLKTVKNIAGEEGVSAADILLSMYIYLISEVTGLQEITIQTVLENSSTVYPLKINLQTVKDLSALFGIVNQECRKKPSEKSYKIGDVRRDLAKGAFSVLPLYCASEFPASAEELLKVYDIIIAVREADGAFSVVCEYNGERLKEEKMKQFINGYMKFIRLLESEYSSNK